MNVRELRAKLAELLEKAKGLVKLAETENRDLSEDENTEYEGWIAEVKALETRIKRTEALEGIAPPPVPENRMEMPNVNTGGVGGGEEAEETRLFCGYLRGDEGADRELQEMQSELRASNDTTMNITTAADGGNLVPTGHYNQIIARRDEMAIDIALGVMMVPGLGTSVGVPYDNEDNGEFISTAESNAYDRDAPALGKKTLTLAKYTKKVDLTVELLEDNDSNLMAFLADFIGRGKAKTDNTLLLAEVASNGTALKSFASATVIAIDEPEDIVFNDALEPYLDDSQSCAWVMRRSVHGEINVLDDASTRRYSNNQQGDEGGPSLLGFPIKYSYKSGATAASTKSVYFGNWFYVGKREAPGMSVIRDPYTRAAYGEVILTYMYRIVYGVLIAEAIGYGSHPSA